MNKRYLDYALYNIWANNRIIDNLRENDTALLTKKLIGSFPTIKATILHIWFAETGWLSRLKGNCWEVTKVTEFNGSVEELFMEWQSVSEEFKDFVSNAKLEREVEFEHQGELFSIPVREIIQTVCNHGGYHRGQVVMMMRQLGIVRITPTDYIEWVRKG